jgi:hypothetical protein
MVVEHFLNHVLIDTMKRIAPFCWPTAVGQLTDDCQPIGRRLSVNWPTAVGQQKGAAQI